MQNQITVPKTSRFHIVLFLLQIVDFISDFVGKAVSFLMTITIFIMIYGVFRRYVLNDPWRWEQITTNFLIAYVMLGAAYALRSGSFVNVDIFYQRFPLRIRAVISMATYILFFLFCLSFLTTSALLGIETLSKLRPSINLVFNPARWPPTAFYLIGVGLLTLQGVAKFIRDLLTAITGKESA